MGDHPFVARRAELQDDLAALDQVQGLDVLEALGAEQNSQFRTLVRRLAALCGGRLAICKEMREIEGRLGLTPKAMADLRWTIAAEGPSEEVEPASGVADLNDRRRRLEGA